MRDFAKLHAETWLIRLVAYAGLAMLFAGVLAFISPFGTYQFSIVERIGYWTFQMAAWITLSLVAHCIIWLASPLRRLRPAYRRIIATVLATLPMIAVVAIANNMMNGWQLGPAQVVELFGAISLIGGSYAYLSSRLLDSVLAQHAAPLRQAPTPFADAASLVPAEAIVANPPPREGPTDPALLERLPPHIRHDIICLQVEDHYIRAHSPSGSAMVLMRFSDALRGIDHIPGAQVHRSWWVASEAVASIRRTGRTAQLTLSNALSVPVSQPYVAQALSDWGAREKAYA